MVGKIVIWSVWKTQGITLQSKNSYYNLKIKLNAAVETDGDLILWSVQLDDVDDQFNTRGSWQQQEPCFQS